MTCDGCAQAISKLFDNKKGIVSKKVDYPSGTGRFEYDPEIIGVNDIANVINNTGHYKVITEPGEAGKKKSGSKYDFIIIGGGSAAFSAAIKAEELGVKTLMINDGLNFGGTCVNVGCIPSKYMVRAGESAHGAAYSPFAGIEPAGAKVDFTRISEGRKALVSQLQQKKYMDVVSDFQHLTLLKGHARFKNGSTVVVNNNEEYTGKKILIATGAKTFIPPIEGLESVNYLTNISLFELKRQPKSLIILGGGYIALELAQAYRRLGTKVTVLQRSEHVLSKLTPDISDELTYHLRTEGIEIHTGMVFHRVSEKNGSVSVSAQSGGQTTTFEAEKLLISTGIKTNSANLGLENTQVVLDSKGRIAVNKKMETEAENIYAAGDVCNTPSYVYTAAHEGKIAATNALSGEKKEVEYSALPWVVFTDPQVAGAGMDETEAAKQNIPYEVSTLKLSEVPMALTANDTRGFIKLIRNPENDLLLGARVVAPHGGELIQLLSMAIKKDITVKELAEGLYPYLTLSEGIKLAAISFGKDVNKLSCCAS